MVMPCVNQTFAPFDLPGVSKHFFSFADISKMFQARILKSPAGNHLMKPDMMI
jgi:hypothetical protein